MPYLPQLNLSLAGPAASRKLLNRNVHGEEDRTLQMEFSVSCFKDLLPDGLPVAQERTSQWTQRVTNSLINLGKDSSVCWARTSDFSPDYKRTHTFGATASNAFGDFILRTEFAYNSNKFVSTNRMDHEGVESSRELGYVIGLDWTGLTDTFVSVQLFQSVLLDDGDYVRDQTDTNVSLLVRRYFLNESLKLELLGIHHHNDGDSLIRLSADYELTSNTTLGFFSDTFDGESNELYGQFDDEDRIGFKVTVGF